jgi:hypothetical protein
MKIPLLLLSIVAALVSAKVVAAQSTDNPWPTAESGIIVHAWYPGFCDIEPGLPPYCTTPRPYYGTFSIFTVSGHYVGSATTDITGSLTVFVKPGRYLVVPDDPALIEERETVTVRGRQFTEVMIAIEEE